MLNGFKTASRGEGLIRKPSKAIRGRWFAFFHTYHVHEPYLPEPPYDRLYSDGADLPILDTATEIELVLAERHPEGWSRAHLRDAFSGRVDLRNPRHIRRLRDLASAVRPPDVLAGRGSA